MTDEADQIDVEMPLLLDDELPEEEQQADETIIAFADETEGSDDDTPLIKRLRDRDRQQSREIRRLRELAEGRAANDDPEPIIPALKRSDDPEFEYDPDRHADYIEKRDAAVSAHAEWKQRNAERENARKRAGDEEARQVEQQKAALGVSDFHEKSAIVRERLSDQQMAVLLNAAENKAKLIYALGRSETRLDILAGEENLAKFAAKVGKMEDLIKVTKKTAPAPETVVRGATASTAVGKTDKHLEALEKEAERTGNRSKVQAYKRGLKQKAA